MGLVQVSLPETIAAICGGGMSKPIPGNKEKCTCITMIAPSLLASYFSHHMRR